MTEMQTRLRPLAVLAIEHWKEHLPKKYAALKAAGTLNSEALLAAEKTLDEQAKLIEQGFPPEAAWEVVRETYLFQPEEAGASEEAPASPGYKLQLQLQKMMQEL